MNIHIHESSLPVHDFQRRLAAIEAPGYFSMLLLSLVAPSRSLALA